MTETEPQTESAAPVASREKSPLTEESAPTVADETPENSDQGTTTATATTVTTSEGEPSSSNNPEAAAAAAAPKTSEAPSKAPVPVLSNSKKSRPPYKYDPDKITLRFLFANRDGLTVTVECTPMDTVGEVKGALLSVWPEDLPSCSGSDRVRLICMGKGMLMPDSKTLKDFEVPVFKTHPTPINVSVRPEFAAPSVGKKSGVEKSGGGRRGGGGGGAAAIGGSNGAARAATDVASQGCACIIL